MFFSDDYLSETDKIDRIYRMLRAERRGRIISIIFKLSLLGLIVYGYYYLSLPAHADIRKKMIDTAQEKMTELIMPMVGSMVQDLTKNMLVPAQTSPTESFFGHLKDEIDISPCETLEEVEKYLESYIFYYNNVRPQWTRKKMTPVQYKNHLMQLTP